LDDDLYEFGDYLGEPSSLSYHVDDMGYISDLDDDDDFPGSCSLSYHGDNMDYISDLDDDCVPGMGKPSSRDGNTYDVSPPIPASECSSNQFPTAEKSIFSTTTTNHNFAFTDARSNYDNMNHLLFSYASNVIAAPCLTAAKQTFDAQSKLFDRGIPSIASPSSLAAAKQFFDEQSKLFDRGNPSTVLLGKFGLARDVMRYSDANFSLAVIDTHQPSVKNEGSRT